MESLYSSHGEGEGGREGGRSPLLPDKHTCSFPFPRPCISSDVFGRLWIRGPQVIRKLTLWAQRGSPTNSWEDSGVRGRSQAPICHSWTLLA